MTPLWITLLLAPTVVVRGHAQVTLGEVSLAAGVLRVAGELRDRDLLTALADRDVVVEVLGAPGRRERLRTDAGGAFGLSVDLLDPSATVIARFLGDAEYLPDTGSHTTVEADVAPLTLHLQGPAEIRLAEPQIEVRLEARVGDVPAPADVRLANGGGDTLATVRTAGEPEPMTIAIPTRALGPPGPVRIVAQSGEARAVHEALLRAPVTVDLDVSATGGVVGDRLTVRGRLFDALGPVADAPVSIRARGLPMATLRTDGRGAFAAAIDTGSLGEGEAPIDAVYAPHVVWREAGRSAPRPVRLVAPRPLPLGTAAAPIAALLAVLTLRRVVLARRNRPAAPPVRPDAGLRTAGASALRRARHDLEGRLWDPFADRPIAGGVLSLAGETRSAEAVSDARGRVHVDALPAGRYTAAASAPGYVTLVTEIALPHRGEFSGFVLGLDPVRAHALRLWRARAAPVTSQSVDHVTPTEIAAQQTSLAEAARAFEAIFYSGRPHEESALEPLRRTP